MSQGSDRVTSKAEGKVLLSRIATLKRALRKYGVHFDYCGGGQAERFRTACVCGLDAALKEKQK